jgi:hypothetical protein
MGCSLCGLQNRKKKGDATDFIAKRYVVNTAEVKK